MSYELEKIIKELVTERTKDSELSEIIEYIMFPAGKLFRPMLAISLAKDLHKESKDHHLLAAALEAHHAYSLAHDDLPCMDDDDERRGRPAAHIKYNEWKALLAGDALINLSFELLAAMDSPKSKDIIRSFAKMMGAQGLILGQYIDLSLEKKSWEQTLRMHELKTGRLIQFALSASHELSDGSIEGIDELGTLMGINFQLLDDLGELTEDIDAHEMNVNAFVNFNAKEVFQTVLENNQKIFNVLRGQELSNLLKVYEEFLRKTLTKVQSAPGKIESACGLSESELKEIIK